MIGIAIFPKDETLRVYFSLALACIIFTQGMPKNNDVINLNGLDEVEMSYLWTALMIIGATVDPKFNSKLISVTNLSKFKPEQEAGYFAKFGSNSLHDRVFLKVLGDTKISFDKEEVNKEFGHQVPDKHASIKKELQRALCLNLLAFLFKIEGKALTYNSTREDERLHMKIGATKIAQSFAFIPETVEQIQLHYRGLNYDDLPFLTKILRAAPKTINWLDLRYCRLTSLNKKNENRWPEIFGGCNPSIKTLYLGNCELHLTGEEGFPEMISATPKDVNYLILDGNELHLLGETGFVKGLTASPAHVRSISLRFNELYKYKEKLANILRAIRPTVTYLDLGNNNLGYAESLVLASALSVLHSNLHTLRLEYNRFVVRDVDYEKKEFAEIFRQMAKTITTLYLLEDKKYDDRVLNNLDNITLSEIFQYFPVNTKIPDSDLLERAKKGVVEKQQKLRWEKEARNRQLLEIVKKFDVTIQELAKLIDQGIDIDCQTTDYGYTPLMIALDAQNERVAEYLLSKGANPLIRNKRNETARSLVSRNAMIVPILKAYELLFATMANDSGMVKSLINSGAEVDFKGVGGYTALLIAVEQSSHDIVALLLSVNPDLSLTCDDGRGVMDLASDEAITEMLIKASNVSDPSLGDDVGIIDPNPGSIGATDQFDGDTGEGDDDTSTFKPSPIPIPSSFFGSEAKSLKKPAASTPAAAAKIGSQP